MANDGKRKKEYFLTLPCTMVTRGSLVRSKRIKEAALLKRVPLAHRLYYYPFIALYVLLVAVYLGVAIKGTWNELYLVPVVLVAFTHVLCILGCQWSVNFGAKVTCKEVNNISSADLVKVVPMDNAGKAAMVAINSGEDGRYFIEFQKQKFIFDKDKKIFEKLKFPKDLPLIDYVNFKGSSITSTNNGSYFGKNCFDVPQATFWELFKEHALAPFFVFQVFCVALWCLDEYWYYSVFTLVMLIVFESTVVQQRLKNMSEFRAMSLPTFDLKVKRSDGLWMTVKSDQLLPGDLVLMEYASDLTVPCDLLLLEGTCVINEAMISGESTPLLKESLIGSKSRVELETTNLDMKRDRNHVLFGGTKVLQITNSAHDDSGAIVPSTFTNSTSGADSSRCVAYVLRTGFNTLQGKLVRTMIFTSERMTANSGEAFAFIGFLLIFAIAAAAYVLYHTWDDSNRSQIKLLLECTLIITAVVPPELPMELSLAVNNSLMALSKFAIFCMEPFRIPLAGKIDVCCFDKTGTLTGENLVVKGVAGLTDDHEHVLADCDKLPLETSFAIASCQSLFRISSANTSFSGKASNGDDDGIVGDPMERTALQFVNWTITGGDNLVEVGGKQKRIARILHRFPFSSSLKRMSCIVQRLSPNGGKQGYEILVTCKGAPEIMQSRLRNVPRWYQTTYSHLAHNGSRVLALAYKILPFTTGFTVEKAKQYSRDEAEDDLIFAGFIVFHCPLKADSKEAIKSLKGSLHHVVMITGDNLLTAVHTAYELDIMNRPALLIDDDVKTFSEEHKEYISCSVDLDTLCTTDYDVAVTGDAFERLYQNKSLARLLTSITVFARSSPSQKELILSAYKTQGFVTLMCGDGTNDVGALKQSHVGMALLDGKPEDLNKIMKQMHDMALRKKQIEFEQSRLAIEQRFGPAAHRGDGEKAMAMQKRIEELTMSMDQEVPLVKLGDASVAAPFTSKLSTIEAVCNLIRQGRCTLVTTMQMYKILALNSLISAYGLSVLHLEGIRYGDFQVTVTGMLLAGCFLFLSKAQPIQQLAPTRPQPNIFNWYVLLSVLLQFLLHILTLYTVVNEAMRWSFRMKVDEHTKFSPNLVNTAVYLVSLLMQVSTFVVNYQGRPFRESLMENKPLRNSLAIVGGIAAVAALEFYPEFNTWLQLVPMPIAFRRLLVTMMVVDFGGCFLIDWLCKFLFFDSSPRISSAK